VSSIFLNHADVRSLLSGLGKNRPVAGNSQSALQIIANSLGMRDRYLYNGIWLGKPESRVGINLTKEAFVGLIAAMRDGDTTAMRNTDRLALIAELLSWKPDAMMSHLKQTTGRLGSNETISNPKSFSATLDHLGVLPTDKWLSIARGRTGINVVSGRVDSGKSTTMQRTLSEIMRNDDRVTLVVADEESLQSVLAEIRRVEMPIVVFTRELRHRHEFVLAREVAKEAPVFMIAWADSAAAAYTHVVQGIGMESKTLVNGVLHQVLVRKKCVFCGCFPPECKCGAEPSRFAVAECVTGDDIKYSSNHDLANAVGRLVGTGEVLAEDADDHFGSLYAEPFEVMRPTSRPRTACAQSSHLWSSPT
jgi:hypothetical protein